MKKVLLTLLLLGCPLVYAQGVLLKYGYGNQITYSELSVFLDGTIKRTEKYGGGAAPESQPDVMLTPETRRQLFFAIDAVSRAGHEVVPGHVTLLGSSSGKLMAYSKDHEYVVRTVERGLPREKDTVTYSTASEARWIEKLVHSLVENRMYLIELRD